MSNGEEQKDFDCLEFKQRAQDRIYEEIKDLTPEQEIEYWRRTVDEGPFGTWWRTLEKVPQVVREKPAKRSDSGDRS